MPPGDSVARSRSSSDRKATVGRKDQSLLTRLLLSHKPARLNGVMNPGQTHHLNRRCLLVAVLIGPLAFSAAAQAQADAARRESENSPAILPLEQSASRS